MLEPPRVRTNRGGSTFPSVLNASHDDERSKVRSPVVLESGHRGDSPFRGSELKTIHAPPTTSVLRFAATDLRSPFRQWHQATNVARYGMSRRANFVPAWSNERQLNSWFGVLH
jgi:hypothetical protein